jgi:hypothetical protein
MGSGTMRVEGLPDIRAVPQHDRLFAVPHYPSGSIRRHGGLFGLRPMPIDDQFIAARSTLAPYAAADKLVEVIDNSFQCYY